MDLMGIVLGVVGRLLLGWEPAVETGSPFVAKGGSELDPDGLQRIGGNRHSRMPIADLQ